MQVVSTTLVAHEPKSFNGRNGQWTLHIFKDAQGNRYQTSKVDTANQCFALLNQPATITFEVEQRVTQNGSYSNNVIQSISAGASAPAAVAPTAAPSAAPTASAPASSGGHYRPTAPEDAQRMSRAAALERAIQAVASGFVNAESVSEFQALVGSYARYIYSGQWAANQAASATGAAVASTPSSDVSGGGEQAGAVATAPAVAPAAPVAPQGPTDDIPF